MAKEGDPCNNPECGLTEQDGVVFRWVSTTYRFPKCQPCERARGREFDATRQKYEPQYGPDDPDVPLKKCSICWDPKPATTEYFPRRATSKDGLDRRCKVCRASDREDNKERYAATQKVWKQTHPEKVSAQNHNRKARKLGAPGIFTDDDIRTMFFEQDGLCYYCAKSFDVVQMTVDHKHPLDLGGANWPENLCLACGPCNYSKGGKTEAQFWTYLEITGQMPEILERRRRNAEQLEDAY